MNGLSILKLTGEKALALIRKASNRRIDVVRTTAGPASEAAPLEGVVGGLEEEGEDVAAFNLGDGYALSKAWGGLRRRYTQRISQSALFAGGVQVKVDSTRFTEPTIDVLDTIPGGKRLPGKDSAYAKVTHRLDCRMKRRKV